MRRTAPINGNPTHKPAPTKPAKNPNKGDYIVTINGVKHDEFDGRGHLPGSVLYPLIADLHLRPPENLIDCLEHVAGIILDTTPYNPPAHINHRRKAVRNDAWVDPETGSERSAVVPVESGSNHPGILLTKAVTRYREKLYYIRSRIQTRGDDYNRCSDDERPIIISDLAVLRNDLRSFTEHLCQIITDLILRRDDLGTLRGFGFSSYETREGGGKIVKERSLMNPEITSITEYQKLNDSY